MSNTFEHTIIFRSSMTPKNIQNLIHTINSYSFVNLYFSTDGGHMAESAILVDFLNYRNSLGSIKVTLYDNVCSAGTLLLTDYEGPIYIKDLRYILFHSLDFFAPVTRKGHIFKIAEEELAHSNETYYEKLLHLGISQKELVNIRKGEDVIFTSKDFPRIKRTLILSEEVETVYQTIKQETNVSRREKSIEKRD